MAEPRIVWGSAHLRPHPNGPLGGLARLYGKTPGLKMNLAQVVEDDKAVDTLAKLLSQGIERVTTKDGRLDMRELSAFVLNAMKENG